MTVLSNHGTDEMMLCNPIFTDLSSDKRNKGVDGMFVTHPKKFYNVHEKQVALLLRYASE